MADLPDEMTPIQKDVQGLHAQESAGLLSRSIPKDAISLRRTDRMKVLNSTDPSISRTSFWILDRSSGVMERGIVGDCSAIILDINFYSY